MEAPASCMSICGHVSRYRRGLLQRRVVNVSCVVVTQIRNPEVGGEDETAAHNIAKNHHADIEGNGARRECGVVSEPVTGSEDRFGIPESIPAPVLAHKAEWKQEHIGHRVLESGGNEKRDGA